MMLASKLESMELEFVILLKGRINSKEYSFLLRRAKYRHETIAETARFLGIRESHARKIASRLRQKIDRILGIDRKQIVYSE